MSDRTYLRPSRLPLGRLGYPSTPNVKNYSNVGTPNLWTVFRRVLYSLVARRRAKVGAGCTGARMRLQLAPLVFAALASYAGAPAASASSDAGSPSPTARAATT